MKRAEARPVEPGPGQESVWDYPRPPRTERSSARIVVRLAGVTVVETTGSVRVLETSHPPVYYVPADEFAAGALVPAEGHSYCEYKGVASYLTVRAGGREAQRAAWHYLDPSPGFEVLRGLVALYPGAMDSCTVDGELVRPQEGGFYGGWITTNVVGPFKGAPGSSGW